MKTSISHNGLVVVKVASANRGAGEPDSGELRRLLHELSNVTTGVLLSAGLLSEALGEDGRRRYAERIREAGQRSAELVREAQSLLAAETEENGRSAKRAKTHVPASASAA